MANPVNVANSRVQLSCSSDLLMAARRVLGEMMMMELNSPPFLMNLRASIRPEFL